MYGGTYYGQTYYGSLSPVVSGGAASYAITAALSGASAVSVSDANAELLSAALSGSGTESAFLVPSGGLVFGSPCNSSADFNGVAAATGDTCVVGNANTGYLGSSIRQNLTITASAETSVRKILPSPVRVSQFRFKADTAGVFSTTVDHNLHVLFSDTGFASQIIHIRLIGVTGGYTLRTVDPNNGFTTAVGATIMPLGSWNRFTVQITDTQIKVFLNSGVTPEITYTPAAGNYVNKYVNSLLYGRYFSQGYTGIQDIDVIWTGNTALAPTNTAGQLADVYQGYLQKYLTFDGAIVRPPAEGSNLNFSANVADVVSEGIAYGLKMAVQSNDQKTFILVDNWTRANLDRRVSTVANTSNNAAPTTGLNLMAFHYNANSSDGKGANTIYDANVAFDADPERATALLWAHNRWGSSSLAVGSGPELITPNYMTRALAIMGDIAAYGLKFSAATGFWYLVNDILQTGDLVQIAPDYNNPAAFKLFAQYDPTNRAKWNLAVSGAYDLLTKASNQVMTGATPAQSTTSGLNPDWIQFTLSTGVTNGTPSTYGDSNYGFNAFRSYNRLYDAYNWYGDASALAALRLPKTFLTAQWNTNAKIAATYNHDGTNAATYERTFFYWADYWSIYAGDTSNTVAAAIYSGKLANKYVQQGSGSYYDNNGYAYFDQSWNLINEMQKAGAFVNYGQGAPIEATVLGTSTMTAAMQSAASYAVTGSLTGSGTETATIGDTEPDSAVFAGTSAVAGSLANSEAETASLSGLSAVTAAISKSTSLSAAITGASIVTSTLSDTESEAVSLSGAGIETSAISNTVLLNGALSGSSVFTAAFSGTQSLSTALSGSSAVTSALSDAETVTSAETGTSSLTASISDAESSVASLIGASVVAVSVSNTTATATALSGSSSVTTTLLDVKPETGALAGASSVTASVSDAEALTSAISGAGIVTAAISIAGALGSSMTGTSAVTSTFSDVDPEAATFSGASAIAASLVNTVLVSTAITGTSVVSASTTETELLSTAITGASAVTSALSIAGALGASITGASAVTATLLDTKPDSGALAGASTLSTTLSDAEALSATLSGAGIVTAALTIAGALGSSMTGSSVVTASLSNVEIEAVALLGSSTVTATLSDVEQLGSSIAGTSAVTSSVSDTETESSAVFGFGTLSGLVSDIEAQNAALAGVSVVNASLSDLENVTVPVTGAAVVTANLNDLVAETVSPAGTSAVTVTFGSDIDPVLATVSGSGSLLATLTVVSPTKGSLLLLGIG